MYRLRVRLRVGLSGCFALTPCLHTLSPHFVSTLCRIRFVPTLCPYALSLRCHAFVPATRSLLMHLGACGLRGVLWVRMGWRTVPPGTSGSTFRPLRSLRMRLGARGLRGVLGSAWIENGTAGDVGLHVPAFRSLPMRLGARGLRSVLWVRMGWRTVPPGTSGSTFRPLRSLRMRLGARGLY